MVARKLAQAHPRDADILEDCACLDDALALAHRAVQAALAKIQRSRTRRAGV